MSADAPPPVVIMGVSGAGKTVVGELLAARLGVPFVDADDLHSEANKRKLRSGAPLTDEDRRPWLDEVGRHIAGRPVVVACSALKRAYRDRLRRHDPELMVVHLHGAEDIVEERVRRRQHPFMPAGLLASQLATLERLDPDERGLVADFAQAPGSIVDAVLAALRERHRH